MKARKLLSWPAPLLEWIGHTRTITCMGYSPNGCYIASGLYDRTIKIWDVETAAGAGISEPLEGHTGSVGRFLTLLMGGTSFPDPSDWTIRI